MERGKRLPRTPRGLWCEWEWSGVAGEGRKEERREKRGGEERRRKREKEGEDQGALLVSHLANQRPGPEGSPVNPFPPSHSPVSRSLGRGLGGSSPPFDPEKGSHGSSKGEAA